jgi:hypothetical protein
VEGIILGIDKIETAHLLLEPVTFPDKTVLGAWKIIRAAQTLGFVMGRRMEDGACLLSCRMPPGDPGLEEVLRAASDYLGFFRGCGQQVLMVDRKKQALWDIAIRMGFRLADTRRLWMDDTRQQLYSRMEINAIDRVTPRIAHPFADVGQICGEKIDLYCTAALDAAPEKKVPAYWFEITPHGEATAVGRIDLRLGFNESIYYGGHIGYGLQEAYRGRGWAAEACRLLMPLIRRHGLDEVIITCRRDNWASRRTCENIGAQFVRYIFLPPDSELYAQGAREECIFHWSASLGDRG